MAKRLLGVALGVVGMGLVVACSSSSGTPAVTTDAGHTTDSGTVHDAAKPVKDSSTAKDAPAKDSAAPTPDAGSGDSGEGDGGEGYDAGPVGIQCNPVTNAPCVAQMGAGADCDVAGNGTTLSGFQCYPAPNTQTVCETCDLTGMMGPFCGAGGTCEPINAAGTIGVCAQYCCTDADCGPGTCTTMTSMGTIFGPVAPMLGLCTANVVDGGASSDAAVTGDAAATGDGGATVNPFQCTGIPATPPSGGSCVTVVDAG